MSSVKFTPNGSPVVQIQEWTQHHELLNSVLNSMLNGAGDAIYRNPALPLGGTGKLTAGKTTIQNKFVRRGSLIQVFPLNAGTAQGHLSPSNVKEGVGFDILSTNNLDDRQVGYSFFSPGS